MPVQKKNLETYWFHHVYKHECSRERVRVHVFWDLMIAKNCKIHTYICICVSIYLSIYLWEILYMCVCVCVRASVSVCYFLGGWLRCVCYRCKRFLLDPSVRHERWFSRQAVLPRNRLTQHSLPPLSLNRTLLSLASIYRSNIWNLFPLLATWFLEGAKPREIVWPHQMNVGLAHCPTAARLESNTKIYCKRILGRAHRESDVCGEVTVSGRSKINKQWKKKKQT